MKPESFLPSIVPSRLSQSQLTGFKSIKKSTPKRKSSTLFLSLKSERPEITCVLHLSVVTLLSPNTISLDACG